jgi:hypothetical protein
MVPTLFVGAHSFDKIIAGHPSLLLRETESGGSGDLLQFHLIAQH